MKDKLDFKIYFHLHKNLENMKKKKNLKTTLGGILAAVGLVLGAKPNPLVAAVGQAVGAIGALLLGASAQDAE